MATQWRAACIALPAIASASRRCHSLRMSDRPRSRCRCTECRRWFVPRASAARTQRVCGEPGCRRRRRAKLARRRRREDVFEYRIDERERQRKHRDAARTAGEAEAAAKVNVPTDEPVVSSRHAPPSMPTRHELRTEVLEALDDAMAASRATLRRRLAEILGPNARCGETATRSVTGMSRATLDANRAAITE